MKQFIVLTAFSLLIVLSAGCNRKEISTAPSQPAKVAATPVYEKYFGPAPTIDKGSSFAFVIFFPSARNPDKAMPLPFFSFDESSLKKVAVERLLGGMDVGSYKGEFQNLPEGARIVSINDTKGIMTVTLSKEFNRTVPDKTANIFANAMALTLRQFKGVSEVRILVEGSEKPFDVVANETAIMVPGPPRLLSLTAMQEKGAKEIEEVNAFFDRPVEIKELKLLAGDGREFQGGLYHSVFDMAAVLKPKDPSQFKGDMPIKVRWRVVDKLGRQAEGDDVRPLEIKTH